MISLLFDGNQIVLLQQRSIELIAKPVPLLRLVKLIQLLLPLLSKHFLHLRFGRRLSLYPHDIWSVLLQLLAQNGVTLE